MLSIDKHTENEILISDFPSLEINDHGWHLAEIIEKILNEVGPAAVQISTFSIDEYGLRVLFNLVHNKLITKLTCIFDYKTARYKQDLVYFCQNVTPEVYLTKNHSKIITIKNDRHTVVIISSANFNSQKRTESYVFTESEMIYRNVDKKFNEMMLNAVKPDFNDD